MDRFEQYRPDAHGTPLRGFAIRAAAPTDALAIAEIDAERNGWIAEEIAPKVLADLERIERGEVRKKVWVACVEDAVVAYARCVHRQHLGPPDCADLRDGWYLAGVVVKPGLRRQGLGRALTAQRLEWIRAHGDNAWYFAAAINHSSIQLHRDFGFSEVSRDIEVPGVSFTGGCGVLFGLNVSAPVVAGDGEPQPAARNRVRP